MQMLLMMADTSKLPSDLSDPRHQACSTSAYLLDLLEDKLKTEKEPSGNDAHVLLLALELTCGRAKLTWDKPESLSKDLTLLQTVLGPPVSVQMSKLHGPGEEYDIMDGLHETDAKLAVAQLALCVTQLGKVTLPHTLAHSLNCYSFACWLIQSFPTLAPSLPHPSTD